MRSREEDRPQPSLNSLSDATKGKSHLMTSNDNKLSTFHLRLKRYLHDKKSDHGDLQIPHKVKRFFICLRRLINFLDSPESQANFFIQGQLSSKFNKKLNKMKGQMASV